MLLLVVVQRELVGEALAADLALVSLWRGVVRLQVPLQRLLVVKCSRASWALESLLLIFVSLLPPPPPSPSSSGSTSCTPPSDIVP